MVKVEGQGVPAVFSGGQIKMAYSVDGTSYTTIGTTISGAVANLALDAPLANFGYEGTTPHKDAQLLRAVVTLGGTEVARCTVAFSLGDDLSKLAKVVAGQVIVADGAVYAESIVSDAILTRHLKTGSVITRHLESNTIIAEHLSPGALGKIRIEAIDAVKVGARNLVLDSDFEIINSSAYLLRAYTLSENLIAGETYTFTIKGTKPAVQNFHPYFNSGSSSPGKATLVNDDTYTVTFICPAITAGNEKK